MTATDWNRLSTCCTFSSDRLKLGNWLLSHCHICCFCVYFFWSASFDFTNEEKRRRANFVVVVVTFFPLYFTVLFQTLHKINDVWLLLLLKRFKSNFKKSVPGKLRCVCNCCIAKKQRIVGFVVYRMLWSKHERCMVIDSRWNYHYTVDRFSLDDQQQIGIYFIFRRSSLTVQHMEHEWRRKMA